MSIFICFWRVIADRGYGSDPVRERWKEQGIELISPHRSSFSAACGSHDRTAQMPMKNSLKHTSVLICQLTLTSQTE